MNNKLTTEQAINGINTECIKWAKSMGFYLPSNKEISERMIRMANDLGMKNVKIECVSDYAFPMIYSAEF